MNLGENLQASKRKNAKTVEIATVVVLYVLLFAGGLWHILGVLQGAMEVLAAPMIIGIAVAAVWKTRQHWLAEGASADEFRRFYAWSAAVFVAGVAVEFVGERTGVIFGAYSYDSAPFPALMFPTIGAAWLAMMLGCTALVQRVTSMMTSRMASRITTTKKKSLLWSAIAALVVALCMAVFDGFMEPAATALRYWTWQQPYSDAAWLIAPFRNYAAWFGISFVFSIVGRQFRAHERTLPRFVEHTFWAQLLYFFMVNLR